jgi:hypothetical protein
MQTLHNAADLQPKRSSPCSLCLSRFHTEFTKGLSDLYDKSFRGSEDTEENLRTERRTYELLLQRAGDFPRSPLARTSYPARTVPRAHGAQAVHAGRRYVREGLDFRIFRVASAIKSPIREVVAGRPLPGSSAVRTPRFNTLSIAASMALAAVSIWNE